MTEPTERRRGRRWRTERAAWLASITDPTCMRCHRPVDLSLPGWHRNGPSADHVIPLAHGGPELPSDGAELQLKHQKCNAADGAGLARRRSGPKPKRPARQWVTDAEP
jgi:5-methylcytosine-specific restriction endonuclease McrA